MEKPVPDPISLPFSLFQGIAGSVAALGIGIIGWLYRDAQRLQKEAMQEQAARITRLETAMAMLAETMGRNENDRDKATDNRRAEFTRKIDDNALVAQQRLEALGARIEHKIDAQSHDIEARWKEHGEWRIQVMQSFQNLRDLINVTVLRSGHAD